MPAALLERLKALPTRAKVLLGVGALGLVFRFVLSALSRGSNDTAIWEFFSAFIRANGLTATYVHLHGVNTPVPIFNHPPLMATLLAGLRGLADALEIRFALFLKLPGLLAEVGSAALVWHLWNRTRGPVAAGWAFAGYGWALCAILVSGYHGNTDAVYACLCLVSVWLVQTRGQDFLGGLALAAAINVKLTPVFLIPALAAHYRDPRKALRALAGLTLGVLPFLPFLVTIPKEFFRNVVAYTPIVDHWGLQALLIGLRNNQRFSQTGQVWSDFYNGNYRYFLLVPILAAAALARWQRWDLYRSAAVAMGLFLVFTPGFGVQYSVLVCPLIFALDAKWGLAWATLSGLTILVPYLTYGTPGFPWNSTFTGPFPMPAPLVGMVAWSALIQFVWAAGRGRVRFPDAPPAS